MMQSERQAEQQYTPPDPMRAAEDEALRRCLEPVTRGEMLELLRVIREGDSLSVTSLEQNLRRKWGVPK